MMERRKYMTRAGTSVNYKDDVQIILWDGI